MRSKDVTRGWVTLDVQIDDRFHGCGVYGITMIAGSVGMEFCASGEHGRRMDTVRPMAGWWVYEKKQDEGIVVGCDTEVYKLREEDPAERIEREWTEEQERRHMWMEMEVL